MSAPDASNADDPGLEDMPRDEPWTMRAFRWLAENIINLLILVLLAVAVLSLIGMTPSLERWMVLIGAAYLAFIVPGLYVGGSVAETQEPDFHYLVDVSVETLLEGGLIEITPEDFMAMECVDGSAHRAGARLHWVKNVDLEAGTYEGVWVGTLSDPELLRGLRHVYECRGMLEAEAREAFALNANTWSIVFNATKSATMSVVDTFENGTLPDEGEGIDAAVNDALEQFDLLDDFDDLDGNDLGDAMTNPDFEPSDETLMRPADD